jgi:signal transduction histidine kinase
MSHQAAIATEAAADTGEQRILTLTSSRKDRLLASRILGECGLVTQPCLTADEVCIELRRGAAALLLADDAVDAAGVSALREVILEQPPWSDLPVLVCAPPAVAFRPSPRVARLQTLGNVTLLDRPVRVPALVSALQTALRARRRQYETRDLLDRLRHANQVKDQFLAAVSHELRTPLNAIVGWAGALRDPALLGDNHDRAIDVIERNARVLTRLVDDLLDMSRLARGQYKLQMESVNLGAVITAAIDSVQPAALAKGVAIELSIASGMATVRGDAMRLQQVIWNLVWNAVKFTPSGGRVDVVAHESDRGVTLTVTDTGAGIAPELLPYVFEPFQQGEVKTPGSVGLGLAIARQLIELHGGTLEAQSAGRGRGSQFTLRLPAAER